MIDNDNKIIRINLKTFFLIVLIIGIIIGIIAGAIYLKATKVSNMVVNLPYSNKNENVEV